MAITLRRIKGSALTYDEIDNNFDHIAPRSSATGAILIPAGSTAERPSFPQQGHFRYNSEIGQFETWLDPTTGWLTLGSIAQGVPTVIVDGGAANTATFADSIDGGISSSTFTANTDSSIDGGVA